MKSKKHNKKRNTAFLYESMILEITKSIVSKDGNRAGKIKEAMRNYFSSGTEVFKELSLYKEIYETKGLCKEDCERILSEVKVRHKKIDKKKLFMEHSKIIKFINKNLDRNFYNNFVPSYKSLASIFQIFNEDTPVREKVLLENNLLKAMSSPDGDNPSRVEHIDSLVVQSFVKKFNEKYSDTLLENQKELLNKYISSFSDNGVQFKIFLNEELGKIKKVLKESLSDKLMKEDSHLVKSTEKVIKILEMMREHQIGDKDMTIILSAQSLVQEIRNDH